MAEGQRSERPRTTSAGGLPLVWQTAARVIAYVAARWIWDCLS